MAIAGGASLGGRHRKLTEKYNIIEIETTLVLGCSYDDTFVVRGPTFWFIFIRNFSG